MYCRLAGIHSICAFVSYPMDIIHWLYLPFIWFSERSILKIQTHLQICHTFLSHLSFWFSGRSIWSGGAPPAEPWNIRHSQPYFISDTFRWIYTCFPGFWRTQYMYEIFGQSEHSQSYFISDTWLVDLHTFSSF